MVPIQQINVHETHRVSPDSHFSSVSCLAFDAFRTLEDWKPKTSDGKILPGGNKHNQRNPLLTLLPECPLSPEGPATPLFPWEHDPQICKCIQFHPCNDTILWVHLKRRPYLFAVNTVQANFSRFTLWHVSICLTFFFPPPVAQSHYVNWKGNEVTFSPEYPREPWGKCWKSKLAGSIVEIILWLYSMCICRGSDT